SRLCGSSLPVAYCPRRPFHSFPTRRSSDLLGAEFVLGRSGETEGLEFLVDHRAHGAIGVHAFTQTQVKDPALLRTGLRPEVDRLDRTDRYLEPAQLLVQGVLEPPLGLVTDLDPFAVEDPDRLVAAQFVHSVLPGRPAEKPHPR